MSRRSTPEQLEPARQAALDRLISDGELPDRAQDWITRWEAIADAEGRPRELLGRGISLDRQSAE